MDDRLLEKNSRCRVGVLGEQLRQVGSVLTCAVDRVQLEYWQAGAGDAQVVLLHGNSTAKEVFHHQFSEFANGELHLTAIDLPGHGGSEDAADPASQYTIPGYASIVNELLNQLDVRDYLLIGWSLGGNIALEMAARRHDIRGMLIMGAPPVGPGAESFSSAYLPDPAAAVAAARDPSEVELAGFVRTVFGRCDPLPELFLETAMRTDGLARETMVSHWLRGADGYNQLSTVATWQNPICAVHGRDEPFVSLSYIQSANWRCLWKNEVQVLDDCGHAPFLERPEAFNKLLAAFAADIF